ncbi:MAG: hypothetical protein IPH32_01955 [Bacteroidetes bacterium]|nr:hypothetical protein [Bacteroidota bacterium]
MKQFLTSTLLVILIVGFASVKPADDLKIDWSRITDKDYQVTYVRVQYDSSSKYAIDTKARMYSTNDVVKVFSKNSVKLIKELLLDQSNYSTEKEDDACKNNYFPYAIIVSRHHEIEGIINIGCQDRVWLLEPKAKNGELLILNEKGLALKEKIFN